MEISTPRNEQGMRKVLMIAYYFPPANSSGSWRPFHFAKLLPEFGYIPLVVTQQGFYQSSPPYDADILKELDARCRIKSVCPLTHAESWMSRMPGMGLVSRAFGRRGMGLMTAWAGLRFLREEGFDLIWATGPPWPALMMGKRLSMLTGKPLVADIRDPWSYGVLWNKLDDKAKRKQRIHEQKVLKQAQRIVYTSPLTADIMRRRSDDAIDERILAITNGFEESVDADPAPAGQRCVFSYIGRIARGTRDPSIMLKGFERACQDPAFAATAVLRLVGDVNGYEQQFDQLRAVYPIETVGQVSYRESLKAMRTADVLVLFQTVRGEGSDVIEGKAFEYLAARRPILGIVSPEGGDAWLLSETGAGVMPDISDVEHVARSFHDCWRLWKEGRLGEMIAKQDLGRFSRRRLTEDLAGVFDHVLTPCQSCDASQSAASSAQNTYKPLDI